GGAGGKFSPWGGMVALTRADSFLQAGGNCAFNISYDLVNRGPVATSPAFSNSLRADVEVVSQQTGLTLHAGETRQINAQAYMAPGTLFVALVIDKDNLVTESDETNNAFRVTITLDDVCAK
ncbi:MAG: CARDB domain-containing protein, partial [Candidatus Methylomirabilaceae bacterium]